MTIDVSGPAPTYSVTGKWDGYPAAELYINGQAVFTHMPEAKPVTLTDLLKLLPGNADVTIDERGTLMPVELHR